MYGFSLSYLFWLRFLDAETNPIPRLPVPDVCRILCSSVLGLAGNLSDLTVASSQYDILLFSETWSQLCVTCQSYWFPDSVALSSCAGARCLGPEGWLYTYEMVKKHFASPNLCVVVAKCCFLGCVV